jgi:hypothetical protein
MPEEAIGAQAPPASDPLRSVAEAMSLAVQAVKEGSSDAQARVSEMMPAVGGFLSRLTYTTCYTVSYGVVFPTLLLVRALPKENAVVHGFVDGARAARDSIAVWHNESSAADLAASESHPTIVEPGIAD